MDRWNFFGSPRVSPTTGNPGSKLTPAQPTPPKKSTQRIDLLGVPQKTKPTLFQKICIFLCLSPILIITVWIVCLIAWDYCHHPPVPSGAWRDMHPFNKKTHYSPLLNGVRNSTQTHLVSFTTKTSIFLNQGHFTTRRHNKITKQVRIASEAARNMLISASEIDDGMLDGLARSEQYIATAERNMYAATRFDNAKAFHFVNGSFAILHGMCRWTMIKLGTESDIVCLSLSPYPTPTDPHALLRDLLITLWSTHISTSREIEPALTAFFGNSTLALHAMENTEDLAISDWQRDKLSPWECARNWAPLDCTEWMLAFKAGADKQPFLGMQQFFKEYKNAAEALKTDISTVEIVREKHAKAKEALGVWADQMMEEVFRAYGEGRDVEMTRGIDMKAVLVQVAIRVAKPFWVDAEVVRTLA